MNKSSSLTADSLLAHVEWMRALARQLVVDPNRADDVVQQSLLSAIERPPRHEGNLAAWLRRVVTNSARQIGRSEQRRRWRELAGPPLETPPSTEELVEQAELQCEVVSAILELREPYRTTVLMRFYRDLSPKDIAAMQGLPAVTVRSRLKRGLEELREALDRRFEGDRRMWSNALLPFLRGTTVVALGVGAKLALSLVGLAVIAGLAWTWRSASPSLLKPFAPPELVTIAEPTVGERQPEVFGLNVEESEVAGERSVVAETRSAPAGSTGEYLGTISDPDGEPIAGAVLTLFYRDVDNWRDHEPLLQLTSDASGNFATAIPVDLETQRPVTIHAEAEGHSSVSLDPIVPDRPIKLALNWTTEVHGRVLDAVSDEPLEGVRIAAWGAEATTASDGSYTLIGIPVEQRVHLSVNKDGYAGLNEYRRLARREPTELTLRLHPGVPLRVLVFDAESSEPLPGVRLGLHALDGSFLTESDSDGMLTLYLHEGEELSVTLHKDGYADFSWKWDVSDTTQLGEPRIPMYALGWIEGSVTDAQGGQVEDAAFYAINSAHSFGKRLSAEDALEFEIPGYARHEVPREEAAGYCSGGFYSIPVIPDSNPFRVGGGSKQYVRVDIGPVLVTRAGDRVRQDIVLVKGGRLHGRVRYNDGAWSRGEVRLVNDAGDRVGSSRTDENGHYSLENVPAGVLTLELRDYTTLSKVLPDPIVVEVSAGEEVEQDIAWSEELVPLRGSVFEADGAPAIDQMVGATWRGPDDGYRQFTGKTDADGSFVIEVVPNSIYDVSAQREPAGDSVEGVVVGAEGAAGIELVLPAAARVRLRLVDVASGELIAMSGSDQWGISWRESGAGAFTDVRKPRRVDGALELDVALRATQGSAGTIDLGLFLNKDGYSPKQVLGLHATPGGETPAIHTIELERGIDCKLKLVGAELLTAERRSGHLFILLHEDQRESLRGPFPRQGGPSNHRINGVNMWVGEPGLLNQRPEFDQTGFALVKGLKPGRYTLESFPADFAFEPATFELVDDQSTIEIGWRER